MPTAKPLGYISAGARARFWSKVNAPSTSGCRTWGGNTSRHGYGLCRNKSCVEISHLELTTPRTNTLRAVAINFWQRAECRNGHSYETSGSYFDRNGSKVCRECKRITARKQWAKKRAAILGADS